ncbi:hypothetical protein ACFXIY_21295 [Streptomyces albidoflavus]
MTPAETLTAAADRLRVAAQDVPAGPWWGDDLDEVQSPTGQVARAVGAAAYPKSRYIAAMHPGVGRALAAWLESWTGIDVAEDGPLAEELRHALTVARQILGSTA